MGRVAAPPWSRCQRGVEKVRQPLSTCVRMGSSLAWSGHARGGPRPDPAMLQWPKHGWSQPHGVSFLANFCWAVEIPTGWTSWLHKLDLAHKQETEQPCCRWNRIWSEASDQEAKFTFHKRQILRSLKLHYTVLVVILIITMSCFIQICLLKADRAG